MASLSQAEQVSKDGKAARARRKTRLATIFEVPFPCGLKVLSNKHEYQEYQQSNYQAKCKDPCPYTGAKEILADLIDHGVSLAIVV
jgi:phosphoglycolate phosphatase-like HAD superfamily hydrolase